MLRIVKNEEGVLLPATVVLLFIVCLGILAATSAFQSKYQIYDSLEKSNIQDAVKKLEMSKEVLVIDEDLGVE